MPADLTSFDAVLKLDYEKTIVELVNKKVRLLDLFTKQDAHELDSSGKKVVYPVNIGRNSGVISASEMRALPTAGQQSYLDVGVKPKYTYGRVQLTGQVINQSAQSKGAFVKAMKSEMDGLIRDLAEYRNICLWGYGSGLKCKVSSVAGNNLTMKDPGGVVGIVNAARFLKVGDIIAVINPAGPALRGVSTISAIVGNVVTVAAAPGGTALNDIVAKASTTTAALADTDYSATPGDGTVPMGLLGMVDDGTYLNSFMEISRTAYPIWKSTVVPNVGALSLMTLQSAIDIADQRGGTEITHFLCHHSVRRAYLSLLQADRRYMGKDLRTPDGGTIAAQMKDITYAEIPMIAEKMAPYGTIFGIDKGYFSRLIWSEGKWDDTDGNVLHRVTGVDAYEAYFKIYDNFGCDKPGSQIRLDGVNATVTAVLPY